MNIVAQPATIPTEELTAFNAGYVAFYEGVQRDALATDDERRGWDDAAGEMAYHRAMLAQAQEVDEAQSEYSDWRWA
jgi:hypothetical protein